MSRFLFRALAATHPLRKTKLQNDVPNGQGKACALANYIITQEKHGEGCVSEETVCRLTPNMLLSGLSISKSKRRLHWRARCGWRKEIRWQMLFPFTLQGELKTKNNSMWKAAFRSPGWRVLCSCDNLGSSQTTPYKLTLPWGSASAPRQTVSQAQETRWERNPHTTIAAAAVWIGISVFSVCSHNRDYFSREPQEGVFLLLCHTTWLCHRRDIILMFLFLFLMIRHIIKHLASSFIFI